MASEAQINANRANAQHSTGPLSPETKFISSHNALKTGLTGRTVLLPTDDVAAYQKLSEIVTKQWQPETDPERLVIQDMVDTRWRLLRIPTLESAIWSLGRTELAAEGATVEDSAQRALHIEALVLAKYKSELGNLALQDNRLRRTLEKLTNEFKALRAEREALSNMRRDLATKVFMTNTDRYMREFGFEFSKEYIMARMDLKTAGVGDSLYLWERTWKDTSLPKPN